MANQMRPYDWYSRAKARLERFLPQLDAELEVDIETMTITPDDGSAEYTAFVLAFSHPSNPQLHWTMEIATNEEYIDHELEQVVTRIYLGRVE